jgi:hypothetical protein
MTAYRTQKRYVRKHWTIVAAIAVVPQYMGKVQYCISRALESPQNDTQYCKRKSSHNVSQARKGVAHNVHVGACRNCTHRVREQGSEDHELQAEAVLRELDKNIDDLIDLQRVESKVKPGTDQHSPTEKSTLRCSDLQNCKEYSPERRIILTHGSKVDFEVGLKGPLGVEGSPGLATTLCRAASLCCGTKRGARGGDGAQPLMVRLKHDRMSSVPRRLSNRFVELMLMTRCN